MQWRRGRVMTLSEAERRVDAIREMAGDAESAHSEEDAFRHEVLRAIASGHENPVALAQIALYTSTIKFPRWCA